MLALCHCCSIVIQDYRAIETDRFLVSIILWPCLIAPLISAIPAAFAIHARVPDTQVSSLFTVWLLGDLAGNYVTLYIIMVS